MTAGGRYDACIVGAGLVGLAVGRALVEDFPGISIVILEKEPEVATHQSGHNSGVIHSGLYYRPGSLKAELCVRGRDAMYRFCEEHDIPFRRSGKLVVATHRSELPALEELERRGIMNGLRGLRRLGPEALREVEPEAVGIEALHVAEAGVVDYQAVAHRLAGLLVAAGARVATGHRVTAIGHDTSGVTVEAGGDRFPARVLVNCAGLYSDRVAELAGITPSVRIIPFRGEYYRMDPAGAELVRSLIYPVPDPRFPFLGVHFTRRIDDTVEVGPNAVLALGREHYRGTAPTWAEVRDIVGSRGFRRLAMRHWRAGMREMAISRSPRRYARLAASLVPAVRREHLLPGGSGVRAQAVGANGALIDDFVIEHGGATVHVLNAPSPAATASLAIGRHVVETIRPLFSR